MGELDGVTLGVGELEGVFEGDAVPVLVPLAVAPGEIVLEPLCVLVAEMLAVADSDLVALSEDVMLGDGVMLLEGEGRAGESAMPRYAPTLGAPLLPVLYEGDTMRGVPPLNHVPLAFA